MNPQNNLTGKAETSGVRDEATETAEIQAAIEAGDPVWTQLKIEGEAAVRREPVLSELFRSCLLDRANLEEALSYRLPRKLGHHAVSEHYLQRVFMEAFESDQRIGYAIRQDLKAVRTRDPACNDYLSPFFYFKGFLALSAYRVGHYLYRNNRHDLAYYLQSLISQVFQVDIHPAATIKCGILIDHATSIVIGETAVVENNVSLLHEVTLGGTGKERGDRHPKVRQGVLIGAGAKILGNVEIGEGAKVGAGSVVLQDVPPHTTVAGVPAKVVGKAVEPSPALQMDHRIC